MYWLTYKELIFWGRGGGSVLKSTYCSSRGKGFDSPYPVLLIAAHNFSLGDLTPPGTPVHIPYTHTHIIFSLIKAHKNQREIGFFVTFLYVYFIRLFFFETQTSYIVEVGLKLRILLP